MIEYVLSYDVRNIVQVYENYKKKMLDLFFNFNIMISDLSKNIDAIEEYKEHYLRLAVSEQCQVDACCLDDDSGALNIVAGSIMYIDKKSGPKWDGQEMLTVSMEMLTVSIVYYFL